MSSRISNHFKVATPAQAIAASLSPRRRMNAANLVRHLGWYAGKIHLNESHYAELLADYRMVLVDVNLASDDLYHLGAVDIRLIGNGEQSITLLADGRELMRTLLEVA